MPRGAYERKTAAKKVTVPSKYCVIGRKVNPRSNYGDRKWFDDADMACSHAANILLKARQDGDINTTEMYVVQIVRIVKPIDPKYEFVEVK